MSDEARSSPRRLPFAEVSRIAPGLYAWLATVLTPVLTPGAPLAARVCAGLALASLAGAVAPWSQRWSLGRWLGVYGFAVTCLACWAFLGPVLRSDQLDAVRGALGALGFLLHALAWGARPRDSAVESLDNLVPGAPLLPRHRPVRGTTMVLSLGVVIGLAPVAVAFTAQRPAASLLAHTAALGSALLVISASSEVAMRLGRARQPPAWRVRASRAVWALGGLTVAAGVALLWLAVR